jgi:hypothetical protein
MKDLKSKPQLLGLTLTLIGGSWLVFLEFNNVCLDCVEDVRDGHNNLLEKKNVK